VIWTSDFDVIAAEPMVIKRVAHLLFLAIALAAGAACVFRAELSEALYDSLADNDAAVRRTWSPSSGGKFALRPERNDASLLRVGSLHAGAPTSLGVPVSFDLTNLGDANDFPNIAVVMIGASGTPVREVVFRPSDYSHGSRFGLQHVELLLQPRHDERRFTVRVFYGDRS
jgi:hypothetical protein